jgi:LacI family transcriptional regulator
MPLSHMIDFIYETGFVKTKLFFIPFCSGLHEIFILQMKKITIKMLAKELRLSISTVSKAISDSHEISVETKLRVNELAKKLNYVPNHFASSLGTGNSKTIGVVIPEVVDSFFAQAINGIEAVAVEKGYHVMIYLTHESFEKEKMILKDFESGRVDGVLLSVSRETTKTVHINDLMKKGIPLVFFDRVINEIATTKITTNDYEMAYQATTHLVKKGCQQILFLSFSNLLSISNKRLEGYKNALLDNGIKNNANNILHFKNDQKKDYLLLKNKLKLPNRADGILASVEKFAFPVYQACEANRLSIPNDVQVISFSNLEAASFMNPPLTTISQPAFEMGKTAATILMKALSRKKSSIPEEDIVLPSVFAIRKSTSL